MNRILIVILAIVLSVGPVDARWRRHHHGSYDISRNGPPVRDAEYSWPPRSAAIPEARSRTALELIPSDWQLQAPDPNWKGKRYISPDGTGWFAVYAAPVEQDPVAAHMKAVVFVEGEVITYLRGEQNWVAVSGYKGERIFYRKAILACGSRSWHHIAFEYPAVAKLQMDRFVNLAASAVEHSGTEGCDPAVSSAQ